ncbi:MAG TPA: hypothetical protein VG942_09070, partial [Hyphomonadaceae bacterium]|nr:hypothetical protein [Hyphomonadaceae bacterium]
FNESAAASRMIFEQNRELQGRLREAHEAGQRERMWREENTQSLTTQIHELQAKLEMTGVEHAAREEREATLRRTVEALKEMNRLDEQARALLEARYDRRLAEANEQLRELQAVADDYSERLIEVYRALDMFDSLLAQGEASLGAFEAKVFGQSAQAAASSAPVREGMSARETAIELEKLGNRWKSLISRLDRSSERGANHVHELDSLKSDLAAIRASTGWRLLAPFRKFGKGVSAVNRKASSRKRVSAFTQAKLALDQKLAPLQLAFPPFDAAAYAQADPNLNSSDSLGHYFEFGEGEGRRPLLNFDPLFYVRQYPDVGASGVSPLLHFMQYGVHEGRSPCVELHPLNDLASSKGMTPLEFFARS